MWKVELYQTQTGQIPASDFLTGLDKHAELPLANAIIVLLNEFGNKLSRPYVAPLKDKIWKLRIPGLYKQYRILYFFFFNEKIVLCQGIHKEKKTHQAEIEKAKLYREDYLKTHKRTS